MKLYAPKYYKDFKCIADRCTHSCCIGWEIDVDEKALERYAFEPKPYAKRVMESIDQGEVPHFRLCEGERCPHLDGNGLCKIITELGEAYLCDICREHPRFYNDTVLGREVGLGMACEEACRLILFGDSYADVSEIGRARGRSRTPRFDTVAHREWMYSVLSDGRVPYEERLKAIGQRYGIELSRYTDGEWRELLASLEYLDEAHRGLFSCYTSDASTPKDFEKPLERALAYFIYRHCAEVRDEEELCASVGFCLFCERLLASVLKNGKFSVTGAIVCVAVAVSEELEYSLDNTEAIKNAFYLS